MSDRFYCQGSPVDGRVLLEGDEARHLARVRRVAVGECVELFDGRGSAFLAEVLGIGRDRVELLIREPLPSVPPPRLKLTLANAVPKGDRFDWLVEKATELGVDRLTPLITERSVVDPRSSKLDKVRRAVIEASKQCRRDRLMRVEEATSFATLLAHRDDSTKLVAHLGGQPIASLAVDLRSPTTLAIGPEGGFSDQEIERAQLMGWTTVSLGPTVLRVETAGLAGAAVLLALGEV